MISFLNLIEHERWLGILGHKLLATFMETKAGDPNS